MIKQNISTSINMSVIFKEMFHKYNADKDFEISQAEDIEARNEFLRQRAFLERTVKTLQDQVNSLQINVTYKNYFNLKKNR